MSVNIQSFKQDVIRDHSDANETNFSVQQGTASVTYNCFAHSVNVYNERILPPNLETLEASYNLRGYFRVPSAEPLRNHDVEVYGSGSTPLHAHRVIHYRTGECESKMGTGPIIRHPRLMLESPQSNGHRKYGRISWRFRYNPQRLKQLHAEFITISKSGRHVFKPDSYLARSGVSMYIEGLRLTRSGKVLGTTGAVDPTKREGPRGIAPSSGGPTGRYGQHGQHSASRSSEPPGYGQPQRYSGGLRGGYGQTSTSGGPYDGYSQSSQHHERHPGGPPGGYGQPQGYSSGPRGGYGQSAQCSGVSSRSWSREQSSLPRQGGPRHDVTGRDRYGGPERKYW